MRTHLFRLSLRARGTSVFRGDSKYLYKPFRSELLGNSPSLGNYGTLLRPNGVFTVSYSVLLKPSRCYPLNIFSWRRDAGSALDLDVYKEFQFIRSRKRMQIYFLPLWNILVQRAECEDVFEGKNYLKMNVVNPQRKQAHFWTLLKRFRFFYLILLQINTNWVSFEQFLVHVPVFREEINRPLSVERAGSLMREIHLGKFALCAEYSPKTYIRSCGP